MIFALFLNHKNPDFRISARWLFILFTFFLYSCGTPAESQEAEYAKNSYDERNTFRVMFYNVENYFDTLDSPDSRDAEFTPDGSKHWNSYRYYEKKMNIAKVTMAVGEWKVPEIIGLAEIENRAVLDDLIQNSPLKKFNYQIIHQESPDWRGIDVAILYRPGAFQPVNQHFYHVTYPFDSSLNTRDILYVKGIAQEKDTLHLFVNHWPSRYGGQMASEPKRVYVAELLRSKVDSIFSVNKDANVIITGDFNDEPDNKSLDETLNALADTSELQPGHLVNLMWPLKQKGLGSYKYRQNWNMLDQFVVSTGLLDDEGLIHTNGNDAHIYESDWLTEDDDRYPGTKPYRTYLGPSYHGGVSDHYPVYLDLRFRSPE